ALWNGDANAWRNRLGQSATDADIKREAYSLRYAAGDPATLSVVAQTEGLPMVRINAARFRGRATNETDEWVEIKNLGGAPQDLTGWSVRVGTSARWRFNDGAVLQ